MYYKEDLGYVYPNRSDEHMISVKHLRDTHFDVNYNYYDKTFFNKVKRFVLRIALYLVGFPVCTIRHGLKIYGRENLKKHKELLKNGAITICNHVFMWDYICVMKAIRPRLEYLMYGSVALVIMSIVCIFFTTNYVGVILLGLSSLLLLNKFLLIKVK